MPPEPREHSLRRALGLWQVCIVGVGVILGAGVYGWIWIAAAGAVALVGAVFPGLPRRGAENSAGRDSGSAE